jgi:hypothetical protein
MEGSGVPLKELADLAVGVLMIRAENLRDDLGGEPRGEPELSISDGQAIFP